jgi:transglutaminase-like putative cysteine protease
VTTGAAPLAVDRVRDRRQVAWAAAAVVFGGAPHLFAVTPWIALLFLALAIWRIAAAARGWRLPPVWVRAPVTVLGFAGVVFTYHGVSGVESGSALLLVMAGMKLLETQNERDRVLVIFIAYFLLFAVFLREQAIWSLAWLATGAIGITAALAQTVRRETLLTPAHSARLAGRIVVQALPLAALLFVLFPRIPGPFWALPSPQQGGVSGLAEEISPGDITELSLSDEVAFRVRFDGAIPQAGDLYWRGPVLERFDGRSWSAIPATDSRASGVTPADQGPAFGYHVVLEPHGKRWLLALETPVSWSLPRAALSGNLQLLSAEPLWERVSYRARSLAGGLGTSAADHNSIEANLRLPPGRNPRTVELARRLRAGAADDRAFIATALRIFQNQGFVYSLSPPALGRQPVDDFLFGARAGFCEHYASALANLARAAGIPARIVVGYQGGERNPFGDYWIVRQANAHAWVEVWVEGAWRRVDPTAAVAPERIERGFDEALAGSERVSERLWRSNLVVNRIVLSWDAANAAWDRWVLAFGPEAQDDMLLALGFDVPKTIQLAALAGAATIGCLLVMAIALRSRDQRLRDPGARLYAELCSRLAAVVRPRGRSETATHYAAAVAAARPDLGPEVRQITEIYLRLRYGGGTDPTLLQELTTSVRQFQPMR